MFSRSDWQGLMTLRKKWSRRGKHTSGANARTHFSGRSGSSKLVPYPFREGFEFPARSVVVPLPKPMTTEIFSVFEKIVERGARVIGALSGFA
jgi:hypothetical protein